MERRQFLCYAACGMGGLAVSGILDVGAEGEADAKTQCVTLKGSHTKLCTVSINRPLKRVVVRKGKNPGAACWVASLNMIFAYHGYTVSPLRISVDAYGGKVPATPWLQLERMNRTWVDDKGRAFVAKLEALPVRAADAAEALAEDQPVIVGVQGRPAVLQAMTYTGDRLGGMTIVKALVCDPFPGKHPRVVTSPEWVEVRYITRVSLTKKLVKT